MFIPIWLFFLITGLFMAVFVIIWAVKTRQFEDQDRARYIPLRGLSEEELKKDPPRINATLIGNLVVLASGIVTIGLTFYIVVKTI